MSANDTFDSEAIDARNRRGQAQLSIAITGAGGAGVISCGELLLQAWARLGGRGLLRKAYGPQIRGGESAALLLSLIHI